MDRETALKIVKSQLTDHRYQHTLGVMETAIELANRYGADPNKAELAAIFHDYAKFRPKDEMKGLLLIKGWIHYCLNLIVSCGMPQLVPI